LAADRDRHFRDDARQRAAVDRSVPARDDGTAAMVDGGLRPDRARRADVHGTGHRVRDRQRRRPELYRGGKDPEGAAAATKYPGRAMMSARPVFSRTFSSCQPVWATP